MFTWTLEDKALCGSIYIKNSPNTLPGEDAISLDIAVALSRQYCMDAYGISAEVMDQYYVDTYFQSTENSWIPYGCDFTWVICFRDNTMNNKYAMKYQVRISAEDGRLIDIGLPEGP